ncbi:MULTISPECIES: phosphoribosylamine--glycine ligase [Virgibacillus]|uniref:Phosphoribosylamine--glycine ligase n=1 Tax=Virgibacillus massiliensis TaxID=1462526 RepID=A0A024QGT2_9BACI|nr:MULTISPECIES: phosphoribosylamine--glycine ligase [Virgibacillus]EQB36986.1 hypothetical protein M948_11195 [Virgibacillus sp. CM-4]MYL43156.1 phosphoribosylamine--glycine ligase [Virgibacillus massiliensis]CDQ41714.1 Phosphoribosylamine--glycine ligase [Virgibacillus massiliensis]
MKILVVGRGGREHSIIMKLAESKAVSKIFAAPGNGGMSQQAICTLIDEMDIEGLVSFVKTEAIDLTIVGPETPLNEGIANRFQQEGLPIFAPTKEAALLEGSKQFAKQFMERYDIPTANYHAFSSVAAAKAYINDKGAPIVVKADGLAAGKGVIVAQTKKEAFAAVDRILVEKTFAEAGATVVIEECLTGNEFSLMAFVHEDKVYPMVPARDHKRAFDHDQGPNTGGMGAFSPVPDLTDEHIEFAYKNILQKTVNGLIKEGRPFTGILYAGLMNTPQGPKVIEFNTRFGDPETQVILPLLKNDLVQVIQDVLNGEDPELRWYNQACVGIVLASSGYPGVYQKEVEIPSLRDGAIITHAGTKYVNDKLVSDGGRVLLAASVANTLEEAANQAYATFSEIDKDSGFFYRTDIAKTEMKQA